VGQKDCKCFWVVLDEGIEIGTLLSGDNIEKFHYGNKSFYRIEPLTSSCSVILLDTIGGNNKSWRTIFINWRGNNNYKNHINTCLYDGVIEIPWSTIPYLYDSSGFNYFIDVDLQPCESFESFLKKYRKGLYMPYKQPVFPEKTNNYEADGFNSLREW
jgi:hypothetical protein